MEEKQEQSRFVSVTPGLDYIDRMLIEVAEKAEALDERHGFGVDIDRDESKSAGELVEKIVDRGAFHFHPEIKAHEEGDDGTLIIRGGANTRNVDRVRDIVEPSAFKRAMPRIKGLPILRNHNSAEPIGQGRSGDIRANGMFIEAGISNAAIGYVQEARLQIQEGLMKSFSIGFLILKAEQVEGGKPQGGRVPDRRITDLDLLEVSVVTIPANMQSTFSVVKGLLHGTDIYDPIARRFLDECPNADEARAQLSNVDYSRTVEHVKKITSELDEGEKEILIRRAAGRIRAMKV